MNKLLVSRTSEFAQLPKRATNGSAGYDICSAQNVIIEPKDKALISTALKMKIPEGYYGRIAARSGLAVKKFIDVGAGVIDSDYRGIVHILLFNFGDKEFRINIGDRIAQLIIEKIATPEVEEIKEEELDKSVRGEKGFGSTGLKSVHLKY